MLKNDVKVPVRHIDVFSYNEVDVIVEGKVSQCVSIEQCASCLAIPFDAVIFIAINIKSL